MKTIKLNITYGNSAHIPDGISYGGMKPFYSINQEVEISEGDDQKEVVRKVTDELKQFVDTSLIRDMRHYHNIRYRCTCKPLYDVKTGRYTHDELCLMGTGDSHGSK